MARNEEFWKNAAAARHHARRVEADAEILRDQFQQRPEEDSQPTWTIATSTINENRPRTTSASYWANQQVLQITFRNGQRYNYYDVTTQQAASLKRVASTGKLINRSLNGHPYGEV